VDCLHKETHRHQDSFSLESLFILIKIEVPEAFGFAGFLIALWIVLASFVKFTQQ
jgi:hypothetical protein